MYIKSKNIHFITLLILFLFLFYPLLGQDFTTENGLKIKIRKIQKIGYININLLIHFENTDSPAIPFLTLINIFENSLSNSKNELYDILRRLGGDFEVKYRYDHIIIKMNILPEHINLFASFIKNFYKFTFDNLKKFDQSKKRLLALFIKKQYWEKSIATQIAYKMIFEGQHLGKSFFFKDSLEKLNIVKIRSFFRRNITLKNSTLILKGDINPYLFLDTIKKSIKDLKTFNLKKTPSNNIVSKLPITNPQIFLFHSNKIQPHIFRFSPGIFNNNFIFDNILNEMLYGKKTTLISLVDQRKYRLNNIRKDILKHKNHYVFCNSFRISYSEITNFIKLIQNPKDFLKQNRLTRREVIQTINFMKKSYVIENSFMSKNLEKLVYSSFTNFPLSNMDQNFNQIQPEQILSYINSRIFPKPVIVIIGDQEKIFKNNTDLKEKIKIIQVNDFFK